jgi:hypothetical protein
MKPARIIVLVIAVVAGGIAALLAGRSEPPPPDRHPSRNSKTPTSWLPAAISASAIRCRRSGQRVVVGKAATELAPHQAETLALSRLSSEALS